MGPGGSFTNFSSLTPVWILNPPDPASTVTETLWLRDPAGLKFVLTSRQVWEVDADGPSSWAPRTPGLCPLYCCPPQPLSPSQHKMCPVSRTIVSSRAGSGTQLLRQECPMDSETALAWRTWLYKDKYRAQPRPGVCRIS